MSTETETVTETSGGCLCGAVRYRVRGPLRAVINCHCEQCRRTSGHFVAATSVAPDRVTLTEQRGLRWYQSSAQARRGFCQVCGSSLFWEPAPKHYLAIMAGTLDGPTGLTTESHIFVDYAGDYYALNDTLPKYGEDEDDA